MKTVETDVLVVGVGAAGSMAAIRASEFTDRVLVVERPS
jgi:succinate dehydrogenase/fumarate reductase flavoprotein subunit